MTLSWNAMYTVSGPHHVRLEVTLQSHICYLKWYLYYVLVFTI